MSGKMDNDHYFAEMLGMMREQGKKDNPTTIQIGTMQSSNSVKIDDLVLNAEDLYIADYLKAGYVREIKTPYISAVELDVSTGNTEEIEDYVTGVEAGITEQNSIIYTDGLKKGDLVAVQKLNNNMYVILARVVSA